jgi:hypothetical protein
MLRKLIALMVLCYALAFAFGAMTAVRWPTLMMMIGWMADGDVAGGVSNADWRELGIAHGAPYLLASLCFYAASVMISARREGSIAWYIFGCAAGFPVAYLVSFETNWWANPSAAEGAVAGAGVAAILLGIAIWDLRKRPAQQTKVSESSLPVLQLVPQSAPEPQIQPVAPTIMRRKPVMVPAAIARQRASFAAYGRKMNAKRTRRSVKVEQTA